MILGVLVVAVVGVGALVFLRKKKSADEGALKLAEHAGPNGLKRGEIRMTYTEKKKTGKPAEAEPTAPKERETVIQTRPAAVSDLPVYSFVRLQKASPYVEPARFEQ